MTRRLVALIHRVEIPKYLRAVVRARESSLIALAALVGVIAAFGVLIMEEGVNILHDYFFQLVPGQRLSAQLTLNPVLAIVTPLVGGLVFGIIRKLLKRWRPDREIDPIEANALHGGQMSLLGSVIVAAQTVWSSGVGASVGLEAGYTQLASGIASRIGIAFRLRRRDLRILVACGAAAGIAAAFRAPLSGAFYGFELILGNYSPVSFSPVMVSAMIGFLVARPLAPMKIGIVAPEHTAVVAGDLVVAAVAGILAAVIGIALMRAVALCERLFARSRLGPSLQTMVGGVIVGFLAIASPQVMSSGHGAFHILGTLDLSFHSVALIFLLKMAASVISLGSGFRGGMFFSSLLTGALAGHLLAFAIVMVWPTVYFDPNAIAVIGMSALSASILGAPLTMTFIALETTGDLWLTSVVLIAVIISSQLTRGLFGYSFATWRFHLRGETIRSATDIGWMRDLTVAKMMSQDVRIVNAAVNVASLRERFPLGSNTYVVAVDDGKRYAGLIPVADFYTAEALRERPARAFLHHADEMLVPGMAVKEAIHSFDRAEAEALAVVDSFLDRRVIGILTEADALRRYSVELEGSRRVLFGD